MSEMYALLIGVDFYFEHALPDGSYFPSLGGCVRDISHVETFLTDPARLKIAPDHIFKLTSSNGQGDEPVEPREQWPTYENMVAKFKELTDVAQPGACLDRVLFVKTDLVVVAQRHGDAALGVLGGRLGQPIFG